MKYKSYVQLFSTETPVQRIYAVTTDMIRDVIAGQDSTWGKIMWVSMVVPIGVQFLKDKTVDRVKSVMYCVLQEMASLHPISAS